jgi:hypothetical protein
MKMRNMNRIIVSKPEIYIYDLWWRHRWKNNIKVDFKRTMVCADCTGTCPRIRPIDNFIVTNFWMSYRAEHVDHL